MKKEIFIALVMPGAFYGLYALSQNNNSLMQRYLDHQKNYRHQAIPKLNTPFLKTGGGSIDTFLAPKYSDKKGGIMDG